MRTTLMLVLSVATTACAGNAYLPGEPGHSTSDLSGQGVRQEWVDSHPDTDPEIKDAILKGVFVPGMTLDEVKVVSNPDREARTGDGFWRHYKQTGEMRYQWFVAEQHQPFNDGAGNQVCELVFVSGRLDRIRYCAGEVAQPSNG